MVHLKRCLLLGEISIAILRVQKGYFYDVVLFMTVKCPGASANMNFSLKASASKSSTSSLVHFDVGRF